MDMELFILVNTATDFSVSTGKTSSLLGAARLLGMVLVAVCAVGHLGGTDPFLGAVRL